ncbi:hypothetical protein SKAU_G00327170 [Synaphobranchus kaupii]|uniref:Reverse transcriptase n=1 Tax=Synaphobranchus kaupii TaxID=118154 RepID=A0A9Q1EPZ4_SYNKA|nr:hypothetical protein SKAU_G00327170 [Synaphobranchus kaupii]
MTTFRGLRIHQGKKKCTARGQQKQCTATAGQTLGTKSQVSNHRAEGSNAADGRQEAEGPVVESSPLESGTENTPGTPTINNQQASQRREKKEPGRRQAIKWPKANEPAVWQKLDNDITVLLEHSLRGRVETKLNSLGDILYEECRSRFGVVAERRRAAPKQKGRREREIEQLVWRRRQLRKQWRKASQEEKEGLKPLWEEVRKSLSNLRRAERIRQRRRRKEKERSNFFKNPFKHAKQLLEDKRSGKLEITKPELEKHIREQYSDPAKAIPLGSPGYVPRPAPPVIPFNTAPPKLSEVADVVRKARAASAPGPNGVPYKLYKYCPGVRKILWKLLKVAWGKNIIPSEWQRAVTVFILKEQNSNSISQFRSIALLNVEGKIFFSIMAKRLTSYLTSNSYIDTSCQKAGVPGFPGYIKDTNVKNCAEDLNALISKKDDSITTWTPKPGAVLDLGLTLRDPSDRKAITDAPPGAQIMKNSWKFDQYVNELNAAIDEEIFKHEGWIQFYYNWAGFKDYNLVVQVIETDDDFNPILNGYNYFVDFRDLSFPRERPKDCPFEEIKNRVGVVRYVVRHGLLWDNLYIGFQNRLSRDPDVYHHR